MGEAGSAPALRRRDTEFNVGGWNALQVTPLQHEGWEWHQSHTNEAARTRGRRRRGPRNFQKNFFGMATIFMIS
jgi:hypothetical protein